MADCILCKIINGDIPSYTIYEDEDFKVILDRYPVRRGHTLIVPKKHVEDVYALDAELAEKLARLTLKIANLLKERLSHDGLNIIQNNGRAAGQSIKHIHVHLVPRYNGDPELFNNTTSDPTAEEFQAILNELNG